MNTVTWVLIVFAYVGPVSDNDSNSLTSVPGFTSVQECTAAGEAAKQLASGTTKVIRFACVKQTK